MKPNIYLRLIRKFFYINFRRGYIAKNLKKRKGACRRCGCCGEINHFLRWGITCRYYDWKAEKCSLWDKEGFEALPYMCKISPFDEKDKSEHQKKNCGYYWMREK